MERSVCDSLNSVVIGMLFSAGSARHDVGGEFVHQQTEVLNFIITYNSFAFNRHLKKHPLSCNFLLLTRLGLSAEYSVPK